MTYTPYEPKDKTMAKLIGEADKYPQTIFLDDPIYLTKGTGYEPLPGKDYAHQLRNDLFFSELQQGFDSLHARSIFDKYITLMTEELENLYSKKKGVQYIPPKGPEYVRGGQR